jgi:hypothetical protein
MSIDSIFTPARIQFAARVNAALRKAGLTRWFHAASPCAGGVSVFTKGVPPVELAALAAHLGMPAAQFVDSEIGIVEWAA